MLAKPFGLKWSAHAVCFWIIPISGKLISRVFAIRKIFLRLGLQIIFYHGTVRVFMRNGLAPKPLIF